MTASLFGGLDVPLPVVLLGAIVGLTYGLLAVGLVLIYRSSRVVNFAHGEIGALGAAFFGVAVRRWHLPYYAVLPLALALGATAGAVAEVAVVRRLRNAPRLMSVVATLGVGQFALLLSLAFNPAASAGFTYPSPPGLPTFDVGALQVTQAYVAMLVLSPVVVLVIAGFLRRSRFGVAIRCSAANPEAARMAGIFAGRMSSATWAIAGALSTFTAVLVLPSRGFVSGEAFGPTLLLRALGGAVVARMTSLPVALAAGVGIGVVEQVVLWNYPRGGPVELVLFGVILAALLLQRSPVGREDEKGSWAALRAWRPLPEGVRDLWLVRRLGLLVGAAAVVVAALLPAVVSNSSAVILVGMIAFAIVGLSIGIVTGLGGELSLGQFAVGAVAATASYHAVDATGSFLLAFVYAGVAGALTSLLIALPALRAKGLMLTVTTLSFALVAPSWLLRQDWAMGEGVSLGRPTVFGRHLVTGKEYYYFALVVLVLVVILAGNVRRSGFGRLLVAVRDNEENLRAFGVSARLVKIRSFLLGGLVAGIGGALYGHLLALVEAEVFPARASIDVVAMTIVGGLGILAGPLLGVLYVVGVPAFLPLDSAGLAATSFGWLLLILYVPGGLAQLVGPLRDRFVRMVAARAGVQEHEPDAEPASLGSAAAGGGLSAFVAAQARPVERLPRQSVLLQARGLTKRFGGVVAVDDVSFDVAVGETLGLIGPNGAGKTTTFELLGGFVRPDAGRVVFAGEDVTRTSPEARAGRGLIRSFQDAALYPTMTVLDVVRLSFERVQPTSFFRSALGLSAGERDKERLARELIGTMGLHSYRDRLVQELSTGTRRITELACLVALQPRLLLLDEPSSGIAQRETEALGGLLRDLREVLDVTLVVIEHDIPLIMGISDRIVAMDVGRVIADGPPAAVRSDPRVVEAYLGGSIEAIERSGARVATPVHVNGHVPAWATAVLGDGQWSTLVATFGSAEGVRRAGPRALRRVKGIGPAVADRLVDAMARAEHEEES